MTKKALIKVAKQEIDCWGKLPAGLALAILFSFIHRVTTGETVEETFFTNTPQGNRLGDMTNESSLRPRLKPASCLAATEAVQTQAKEEKGTK